MWLSLKFMHSLVFILYHIWYFRPGCTGSNEAQARAQVFWLLVHCCFNYVTSRSQGLLWVSFLRSHLPWFADTGPLTGLDWLASSSRDLSAPPQGRHDRWTPPCTAGYVVPGDETEFLTLAISPAPWSQYFIWTYRHLAMKHNYLWMMWKASLKHFLSFFFF